MRGGKREGAGRPPGSLNKTPATKKTRRLYERLTDAEYAAVKAYIKALRQKEDKDDSR